MKTQKPFTIPKLCSCKGDITKSWYVYFYYTDTLTGEKKMFRYKFGINQLRTKREREREAGAIVTALHLKLQDGWNPITDKSEDEHEDLTVSQALDSILALKKSYITPRSYKTYYDQLNLFKKWLVIKKFDKLFVHNFTAFQALQYFDWLLGDKGYCGKTYNSHLGTLRSFFNSILERQYIQKNPLESIKQVRQDTGKNTTYSHAEEKLLEKYMLKNERNFYYATRFVRYCFLRRSELAKLQVKHIKWDNKTIIIPSESAKSRVQDSITISKTLEKCINEMGILDLDPNTYVFGHSHPGRQFKPTMMKMNRVDDFSDRQRKINKLLNIKEECTFYSWKHTGAVELYNLTKDPYTVMRQCRHSDIKMTMIYLRSMGCGVNEQVREW
jgi:integrase